SREDGPPQVRVRPTIVAVIAMLATAIALVVGAAVNNAPVRLGSGGPAPGGVAPAAAGTASRQANANQSGSKARENTIQSNVAFFLLGIGAALAASGGLVWLIAHRHSLTTSSLPGEVIRIEPSQAYRDAA